MFSISLSPIVLITEFLLCESDKLNLFFSFGKTVLVSGLGGEKVYIAESLGELEGALLRVSSPDLLDDTADRG